MGIGFAKNYIKQFTARRHFTPHGVRQIWCDSGEIIHNPHPHFQDKPYERIWKSKEGERRRLLDIRLAQTTYESIRFAETGVPKNLKVRHLRKYTICNLLSIVTGVWLRRVVINNVNLNLWNADSELNSGAGIRVTLERLH